MTDGSDNGSESQSADEELQLSKSQQAAYDAIMEGESVFITGPAGTGKSVLMQRVLQDLREKYPSDPCNVAITAFSGIAAVHIGGQTLHSWAGIRPGNQAKEALPDIIRGSRYAFKRWRSVKALIVDEISMLDGCFFDKLDYVARSVRQNDDPFGGIQLIACGDFAQLPPVRSAECTRSGGHPYCYAFEADTWEECIQTTFLLEEVFRQKDPELIKLLREIRTNDLSSNSARALQQLSRSVEYEDGIEATVLFAKKDDVSRANGARLANIQGTEHEYIADDDSESDCFKKHVSEERLTLKVRRDEEGGERILHIVQLGAQVMIIKNFAFHNIWNGVVGVVVGFKTYADASRDSGIEFLEPHWLRSPDPENTDTSQLRTTMFIGNEEIAGNDRLWPVVQIPNGRKLLCLPSEFSVEVNASTDANREQIPLILAWAITIHKSQGQTIERLKVDLNEVWADGHVYVALSRATSLETLEVQNYRPGLIKVNARVTQFYRELEQSY